MEEYKYKLKKRKTTRHITEDREVSSDDDSEPDSKQDFNETSEQFTNGVLIHMNGILIVPCKHSQFIDCQVAYSIP